jgi:hypothetical protein
LEGLRLLQCSTGTQKQQQDNVEVFDLSHFAARRVPRPAPMSAALMASARVISPVANPTAAATTAPIATM